MLYGLISIPFLSVNIHEGVAAKRGQLRALVTKNFASPAGPVIHPTLRFCWDAGGLDLHRGLVCGCVCTATEYVENSNEDAAESSIHAKASAPYTGKTRLYPSGPDGISKSLRCNYSHRDVNLVGPSSGKMQVPRLNMPSKTVA